MNDSVNFIDFPLQLLKPSFDSKVVDLIMDLNHLRKKTLKGTTHPQIFFQLKELFHMMESIGSARIEGNRTTIDEFIDYKTINPESKDEELLEINNMEEAMSFIDEIVPIHEINKSFICELHKLVVKNLSVKKEGDYSPGQYRTTNVSIQGSKHRPPEHITVESYMQELISFINDTNEPKFDLLKVALAHHRFAWIHPFRNGNGRTGRLLTYAMLVKYGFNVHHGRILNPTAVFCNDRDQYYDNLSKADTGNEADLLHWCEYVLSGLKIEIEKIDNLLDASFLIDNILIPTIQNSFTRMLINEPELKVLLLAAKKQVIKLADIKKQVMPKKLSPQISRFIRQMKEKGMLVPENDSQRTYVIGFSNKYLLRSLVAILGEKGFLPVND